MSAAVDAISYEDLYARWEKGNWSAMAIDFGEDRRQWAEDFSELERRAALWNYSVFFHRFMHEVVERGDGTVASALEATRPELTWGFVKTFEMLDRVTDELRR